MLRRNGKPHSCEPCRISKVKCDHTTPICKRCQTRGIVSKCYYHPAPLTKQRSKSVPESGEEAQERPTKRKKSTPRTTGSPAHLARRDSTGTSLRSPPNSNLDLGPSTTQNAYLGSTSFLSVFHESVPNLSMFDIQPLPPELVRWQNRHLSLQSQLFKLVTSFKLYESLIAKYFESGLFAILPAPIVLSAIHNARKHLENEDIASLKQKNVYRKISQNTAKPFQVSAMTTAEEFYQSFTGDNLRWEFIGVIFTLAGLSVVSGILGNSEDPTIRFADDSVLTKQSFAAQMVAASNDALEICRPHEKINDLMIWLEYNHCVLASMILDETSHLVYRGVGQLTSDMFAMGYHRNQPPGAEIPFFLSQTRRRIFTAAYRSDKNLATFLGRPPRIHLHYCDIALPLDLDDASLMLSGDALNEAISRLDPDGWSSEKLPGGRIRPASLMRLRYIMSIQREKILEISLGRKPENFIEILLKTYQECQELWASIPAEFRYDIDCWKVLEPISALALLVLYLEYNHSLFQIQRILCQHNVESSSLLNTSMQLLSAVLHLLKAPEHTAKLESFSWIFLFYGIPASGVLASELYQSTLCAQPWPPGTPPRSQVIRDLGMLISWFETATLPPSPTTRACLGITKVLSKLLDDTLNYQPSSASSSQPGQSQTSQQQVPSHLYPNHQLSDSMNMVGEAGNKPDMLLPATSISALLSDGGETRVMDRPAESSLLQPNTDLPPFVYPAEPPDIGIGIDDQFNSEKFLSWLDDLDWDASVPDLLF